LKKTKDNLNKEVNKKLNLTQKERMLLEDQKNHEQVCIQKYLSFASQASDPQLQQLFRNYANQEQQHFNTINQILNGQIPNVSQNNQNMQSAPQLNPQSNHPSFQNKDDAELCKDLLMTEKYISGTYDTAIFEFSNSNIRQILNHIQKEEQQHGEGIFNYMQAHGMYSTMQ